MAEADQIEGKKPQPAAAADPTRCAFGGRMFRVKFLENLVPLVGRRPETVDEQGGGVGGVLAAADGVPHEPAVPPEVPLLHRL